VEQWATQGLPELYASRGTCHSSLYVRSCLREWETEYHSVWNFCTWQNFQTHDDALVKIKSRICTLPAGNLFLLQELRRLVTNASAKLKNQWNPSAIAPAAEAIITDFGRLEGEVCAGQHPPLAGSADAGAVRTNLGEAGDLVEVVKHACMPAAQQLLLLLGPLLATLASGSIPVRLLLRENCHAAQTRCTSFVPRAPLNLFAAPVSAFGNAAISLVLAQDPEAFGTVGQHCGARCRISPHSRAG